MSKQTSVEWLYRWINDNYEATIEETLKAFELAKEMHKQEIIDAVGVGSQFDRDYLYGYHDKAEQYYQETFNSSGE